MSSFSIQGQIHALMPTQQVSASFRKRELVVSYAENPQYPQLIKFETIQERCDQLDAFQPGDTVQVHFNLRGREWTNPKGEKVYFTTLEAWRVEAAMAGGRSTMPPPADPAHFADLAHQEEESDLPF
ncbi:MAG: DUF3127 domain-containing protein [Bacteroidetes bacterium]|jgi:hypothetical protein|nr:DUF3127 domain-containing protein [Bacteroidota bacterium]